jgi:SAM-dependent methyltransferase
MEAASIAQQQDVRGRLHGLWAAVAGGWGDHAEFVDRRGAEVTARMLELASPQRGERVLELACGPGSVGLAAAPLVAPGEVVMSDVVKAMTAIAARRAAERGLGNVTTRELDIESIDERDSSYDVVLCREGLMFATDHARATGEIARVLKPGGRAAIAVWGPRERNPWLALVFDAVSAQAGHPLPPPGVPGPFALDDAGRVEALLSGAGLDGVSVDELSTPLRAGSFEEWWERTRALAGPLAKILESMPPDAVTAIEERLREATKPYETDRGLELPGVTLLANGQRAPV